MIDAIYRLENPTNVTDLQAILGLCNIFRLFQPKIAGFSTLLDERFCKDHRETFEKLANDKIIALKVLKNSLVKSLFLALPH